MSKFVGTVTTDNGRLELNFERIDGHPYKRSLRGMTAYYTSQCDIGLIENEMRSQDTAYAGPNSKDPIYRFRGTDGGVFTIAPYSLYGITERFPFGASFEYLVRREQVKSAGYADKLSIGSICNEVMKRAGVDAKQLPTRYRMLATHAINQGPMHVCMGGADYGYQYDKVAAFLNALRRPVPVPGSYTAVRPIWPRIRRLDGFVRATAYVSPDDWAGRIPPLPMRERGATFHPTGYVNGYWTIPQLAQAEEMGCTVVKVYEAITCKVDVLHGKAADLIEKIPHKRLRKSVYLRYWGRFASAGGWTGYKYMPKEDRAKVNRFRWSKLYWVYTGKEPMTDYDMGPGYMPDHSAYIATHNCMDMALVCSAMEPYATVGAHVDAIWTDRPMNMGPSFQVKSEGALRFYGIGTYDHNGRFGAMGLSGDITSESLAEYGKTVKDKARDWHFGIMPGESRYASSDPLYREEQTEFTVPHDSVYDKKWTANGWIARSKDQ